MKLQPYQIEMLKYMSQTKKRRIMFNPLHKMKTWIQLAAAMQALAIVNPDGTAKTYTPKDFTSKDFTPKPTGNVKLNSHYHSKSSRKSRQKRGY